MGCKYTQYWNMTTGKTASVRSLVCFVFSVLNCPKLYVVIPCGVWFAQCPLPKPVLNCMFLLIFLFHEIWKKIVKALFSRNVLKFWQQTYSAFKRETYTACKFRRTMFGLSNQKLYKIGVKKLMWFGVRKNKRTLNMFFHCFICTKFRTDGPNYFGDNVVPSNFLRKKTTFSLVFVALL